MAQFTPERYFKEERANALTHGLGVLLAIISTPFLFGMAAESGATENQLLGVVFFGASMFVLYLASTIYHSVHHPARKRFCRRLDHIAIYFLIAGSHTPFILLFLDNGKGWAYLIILWSLGFIGTLGKLLSVEKWERLSLALYIFMGWMFVFVLPDVWPLMSGKVLSWIGIGGVFYTTGVVFYANKKLKYSHAIWHVFVLAGTAGHYVALWQAFD